MSGKIPRTLKMVSQTTTGHSIHAPRSRGCIYGIRVSYWVFCIPVVAFEGIQGVCLCVRCIALEHRTAKDPRAEASCGKVPTIADHE